MPRARRAADVLLLAVLLTATWHRVAWQPFGRVTLADLLALPFVVAVALTRPRIPREARTLAMIGAGLFAVTCWARSSPPSAASSRRAS